MLCFPGDSDGKESTCNPGNLGWEDPQRKVSQPTPEVYNGESPWAVELEGYMGSQSVRHN